MEEKNKKSNEREHMKAVICPKYGPPEVLQLTEVPKPSPKDNEILVRVLSAAVTTEDPLNRMGKPYIIRLFVGFTKPKNPIPGSEFAGVVEAVGKDVKKFKKGDRVMGSTGTVYGSYAEYVCLPEDGFLGIIPENMTYDEASPVCASLAAWNFLVDKAKIKRGQKVLINGASGAVGSAAVQIARHFGAEVTGVCSAKNLDLVRSLGADSVIDYKKEDFTKNGKKYDIVFDAAGKSSFRKSNASLTENGIYLSTVPSLPILLQSMWTKRIGKKKAKFSATGLQPMEDRLSFLKGLTGLVEAGKLKSVMDMRYTMEQVVEAHRYVEEGRKTGNVVMNIGE
jgi:NADPH:quinone reductase-like Zn-dependent oxidoreductase